MKPLNRRMELMRSAANFYPEPPVATDSSN